MKECKWYNKLAILLIVAAFLNIPQIGRAESEKQAEHDPNTMAMYAIFELHQKGSIKTSITEPNYLVDVEPSFWQGLVQKDKEQLIKNAQITAQQISNKSGQKLEYVILRDVNSKAKLGTGSIKSGKIEIEN